MRLYNGCPDDALAAVWKSRADARAKARELGYSITYFPLEERYMAFRLADFSEASPFCYSVEDCLDHIETAK